MVVHNPESNMGNACGCPPTMEIVHRGIVTGLGTDANNLFNTSYVDYGNVPQPGFWFIAGCKVHFKL